MTHRHIMSKFSLNEKVIETFLAGDGLSNNRA